MQFVDSTGKPFVGGKVFSYQAGTTTPLATYTDSTLVTPNANPVVLDSSGAANIWIGSGAFKFVLQDSLGNTIWTRDNVVMPGSVVSISLTSQVTGILPIANGGTGQATKAASFDALSPMTTGGDVIYGGTSGTGTRLPNGSAGQVLTSQGTTLAPQWGPGGLSNPMTTGGDIIYGGASGLPTRLPNGSSGQFLKSSGSTSAPTWSAVSAAFNVVSKTTTYSAVINDYILASSASFTITLPTAVGVSGQQIGIQHNGTSLTQLYTLNTTSAQTIGGIASGSYALYTNGEVLVVVSDGANWQIQSHKTTTGPISAGAIQISSTSAYTFTVTSATVVAGDTYTNNGQTFTVATSGTVTSMPCPGTGAPLASGTLTKATGSGPATLAFSAVSTSSPSFGTTTINDVSWTRNGRWVTLIYTSAANGGSPAAGNGDYVLYLPTGMAADLTNYVVFMGALSGATAAQYQAAVPNSNAILQYTSSGALPLLDYAFLYSSNQLRFYGVFTNFSTGASSAFTWGSGAFSLNSTALTARVSVTLAISGWQP